ncbi:MAG: class I SAM-dependent methyltransferase [Elusimicrobiota bacterium]
MRHGDFTELAKHYINRPGYSLSVLEIIGRYINAFSDGFKVADVGAGTGKLTENLAELGFSGYAVEPNGPMRKEGQKLALSDFCWRKGTAEHTGLPDSSVDWVLMGSSFHWTKTAQALREFRRILKKGGFLTVLWNPRDLEKSVTDQRVDKYIRELLPDLKRVSSGSKEYTKNMDNILVSTKDFKDPVFIESGHIVKMSRQRYIGVWKSVNDIRVQAGKKKFSRILNFIKDLTAQRETVTMYYKTRAWTVKSTKRDD